MKKTMLSLVLAFTFLASPSPAKQSGTANGSIIPLYTFPSASALAPGGTWAQVAQSKIANPSVTVVAIVNPSSGPGTSQSASYVSGIAMLRNAGVVVLGYTHCTYGSLDPRPQIDAWKAFYNVDGIFVDEMPPSIALRQSMADIDDYAKGHGYTFTVGNPGTAITDDGYFDETTFDAIMIYESQGFPSISTLQANGNDDGNRRDVLSIIPYNVPTFNPQNVIDALPYVKYIYVTNDTNPPNPWDSLPPYYAQLVAALAGNVAPVTPATPTKTGLPVTPTKTNTAVPSGGSIDFAVIGDYGSGNSNELAVANMVKGWNPDFVITTGDNCYGSLSHSIATGNYYGEYVGNLSTNRFFPAIGNHDYADCGGIGNYINYFTLPNNEYYYDYVKPFAGGSIHFFSIDHYSHGGTNETGETGTWLKAGLASSTSTWNVVYFHASPYTSGVGNGSYTPMRWPFSSWQADVVITGHEHVYEHLIVNGVHYFVNGAGGASMYPMGGAITGSQVRYNNENGAMFVTVNNTSFNSKFFNKSGVEIENYTISASGVTPAPATPTRTNIPISTPTKTLTATVTNTFLPSKTPTITPTKTITATPSRTATATPSRTPSRTPTRTNTPIPPTVTFTPSKTVTPTQTIVTPTPTATILPDNLCAQILWNRPRTNADLGIRPSASLSGSTIGWYRYGLKVTIEAVITNNEVNNPDTSIDESKSNGTWAQINRGQFIALKLGKTTYAKVLPCK